MTCSTIGGYSENLLLTHGRQFIPATLVYVASRFLFCIPVDGVGGLCHHRVRPVDPTQRNPALERKSCCPTG